MLETLASLSDILGGLAVTGAAILALIRMR
jgi:hypothetical protein